MKSYRKWAGKRVLDAGAGKGRFAKALAMQGARVYTVDISREMFQQAQESLALWSVEGRIMASLADCVRLPFRDNVFDAIVCMNVFMHIPQPEEMLYEFRRVIRKGGILLGNFLSPYAFSYHVQQVRKTISRYFLRRISPYSPSHPSPEPVPVWRSSERQFQLALSQAGFHLEKLEGYNLLKPTIFPHSFAQWFFLHIEPCLRSFPLLRPLMSGILVHAVRA